MKYLLLLVLIFSVSCNTKKSPEATLQEFVNYRFKDSQSRDDMLDLVTGKVADRIRTMSEEDFKKFVETQTLSKRKFKVNIKNCEKIGKRDICYLTYTVGYKDSLSDSSYRVETRKIATLENIDKEWRIADVNNVKTAIDTQDAIDVTNKNNQK
ncbi:MAG: hypothetical protein GY909_11335 [Oligoflexia bacterium]|nr:hypothetical protein [Oligoflexia bacterium]